MKAEMKLRHSVLLVPALIFLVVIVLGLVFKDSFVPTLTAAFETLMWDLGCW